MKKLKILSFEILCLYKCESESKKVSFQFCKFGQGLLHNDDKTSRKAFGFIIPPIWNPKKQGTKLNNGKSVYLLPFPFGSAFPYGENMGLNPDSHIARSSRLTNVSVGRGKVA